MLFPNFTYDDYNFSRDLIGIYEYFITPFYLLLIYTIAYIIRNKYYRNSPLKRYFIPAISVKLIGAVTVCLLYNYYYKGGDTNAYFNDGRLLSSILLHSPVQGIRLLFSSSSNIPNDLLPVVSGFRFVAADNTFFIVKISCILQLFTFQSFIVTSLFFGFISFWSSWWIFRLFVSFYPLMTKQFALSFLFIPSVFFWGSGILKDTVCLSCLCILFVCFYNFFFAKKDRLKNFIIIMITGYIITIVKTYIIMCFGVCCLILIFLHYRSKISSRFLRQVSTPIFILLIVGSGFGLLNILGKTSQSEIYSLDHILRTAEVTREYIYYVSSESSGSAYSLGDFDNSIFGFIKVFPAAVNVTLFRPYIWEVHNFIALFAALESLIIFGLTLKVIFKTGFIRIIRIIIAHDLILFCIIFSIIFAFAVGVTTYNFGSLTRYKIPCIPFYVTGLFLIDFISSSRKKEYKVWHKRREII